MKPIFAIVALLGSLLPGLFAAAPTNAVPEDAFALRRWEWIPAFPAPRLLAATFPRDNPVLSVEKLAFGDGRLWLAVRPARDTNTAPGTGRLWAFTPDANRLEPVKGVLAEGIVNGLHFDDRRLWLALNGGVGAMNTTDFSVEGYSAPRGMLATNLVGIDRLGDVITALGAQGGLYGLPPNATDFIRGSVPAPAPNPRSPQPWRFFAASGDWLLAATGTNVLTRHAQAMQWLPLREELSLGSPRFAASRVQAVTGDRDGHFWIGSDAGLHWLEPETGQVENRFFTPGVTVAGGLGTTVPPGFQLTATAYRQARDRVMNGVRDRMRDRARRARTFQEGRPVASPVTPTSRLPGAVTALLQDKSFLWIATTDGPNALRGRVLLYHLTSHRWVGWFPVGLPVRSLAANDRFIWLGLDASANPQATPLVAVDKLPLHAIPQARWTDDGLDAEELGKRLAALPVKERAVYAFFSGDAEKVVKVLAPDGAPRPDADAESLFLLAFAHDAIGLNRPDKLEEYLTQLQQRHPDSLFTDLAKQVRPAPRVTLPVDAPATETEPETVEAVLARRDLNNDGKLNAVELRLWRGPEAKVAEFDRDGDKALNPQEIEAMLKR